MGTAIRGRLVTLKDVLLPAVSPHGLIKPGVPFRSHLIPCSRLVFVSPHGLFFSNIHHQHSPLRAAPPGPCRPNPLARLAPTSGTHPGPNAAGATRLGSCRRAASRTSCAFAGPAVHIPCLSIKKSPLPRNTTWTRYLPHSLSTLSASNSAQFIHLQFFLFPLLHSLQFGLYSSLTFGVPPAWRILITTDRNHLETAR